MGKKAFHYSIILLQNKVKMNRLENAKRVQEKYAERKKEIIENNLDLPGIKKARVLYPFTTALLKLLDKAEGATISYLHEKDVVTPVGRPVIFANTHRFKQDFEKISLSTKAPSFVVASDFVNSYHTINGWYLNTRPTIFVDPYSKEDRKYTYKMMVRYLKAGLNCMIFPEGVWNLSENKIVLDTFFGTARAAMESNAVIVCTAIERYGKEYVINRNGYIEPADLRMKPKREAVAECNTQLRDHLASLLMEIWFAHAEAHGLEKRADISRAGWEETVRYLMSEWKGYRFQDNVEQRFHNQHDAEYEQVQKDLGKLRNGSGCKGLRRSLF